MLDHRGVRELLRRLAPRNSAAIIAMLTGDDYHAATLAADAVGASSDPAVIRTLRTVASLHRDKDVRAAAIRALGNAGDREASPTIAAALNDPSWEVRVQATIAAGRLRLVHLAPQLAEALGDDNWWLQWRAAQALAKLGPAGEGLLRQIPFDSPVAVLADVALAEVHSA
jgi:HEAT repeat protein